METNCIMWYNDFVNNMTFHCERNEKMSESKDILDTVYRENELYIRKLCNFKLKSIPDEVDDCVQETFTAFAEALYKGKEIENPKAWLLKVANNIIKDVYSKNAKSRKRIVSLDENITDDNLSYCMDFEQEPDFDEISVVPYKEYVLGLLTEDERNLIRDRYELNKSIRIIAADWDTTENNIYQRLSRLKIKTKIHINKVLNEQSVQK